MMNLQQLFDKYENQDQFEAAVNVELKKLMEQNPNFCYIDNDVREKAYKANHSVRCKYNGPAINANTKLVIGNPCNGCIFGQALQALGWNDKLEMSASEGILTLTHSYIENYDCTYHSCGVRIKWPRIQTLQDNGTPWGGLLHYIN